MANNTKQSRTQDTAIQARIIDLNGNPIRRNDPCPVLRRTASGTLYIYAYPPADGKPQAKYPMHQSVPSPLASPPNRPELDRPGTQMIDTRDPKPEPKKTSFSTSCVAPAQRDTDPPHLTLSPLDQLTARLLGVEEVLIDSTDVAQIRCSPAQQAMFVEPTRGVANVCVAETGLSLLEADSEVVEELRRGYRKSEESAFLAPRPVYPKANILVTDERGLQNEGVVGSSGRVRRVRFADEV